MIKECKVIMQNGINIVVLYDGIEVQLSSDTKESSVFIKQDNDRYILVTKQEYEKSLEEALNKVEIQKGMKESILSKKELKSEK